MSKLNIHLNKLLALASRHKFIIERTVESTKGSYSVYEYGPLGSELRRNLRQLWWRDVVIYKERVNGVEFSMFEPENRSIFTEFERKWVTNKATKLLHDDNHKPATKRYVQMANVDKLVNEVVSYILENNCNDMTKTRDNLKELILRNTIQVKTRNNMHSEGLDMWNKTSSAVSLPQGFAWNGKYVAMDSDTNFLRNIEDETLCLQYFFQARTAKYWLNYWKRERLVWWRKFANVPSNFSVFDVQQSKSQANHVTEVQYAFPWGKEEIETIEYWPNSNPFGSHLRIVSEDISELHPHILQASASLNKGFVALLVDAIEEKERVNSNGDVSTKSVLYLHPSLAPVKVAILSQNKEKNELSEVSLQLASELRRAGISTTSSEWDDRPPEEMYAYNDEIGTPYCITILESTLSNGVVTLRNRDTTLQEFIHISDVLKTLQNHLKPA